MQPIRLMSGIVAAFTTVILLLAACGAIPALDTLTGGGSPLNETISIHGTLNKIEGSLIVVDGQTIQLPENFTLPDNAHPGDQLALEVEVGADGAMTVNTLEVEIDNTAEPTEATDVIETPEATDTPDAEDTVEVSDTPEVEDTVEAEDTPEVEVTADAEDTSEPEDTTEPEDTPESGDDSSGGGSDGGGGDDSGGSGGDD